MLKMSTIFTFLAVPSNQYFCELNINDTCFQVQSQIFLSLVEYKGRLRQNNS